MTRYLFLKSDKTGHKKITNAGIDVRLLPLLSMRYV